jgi:hypothetical protein
VREAAEEIWADHERRVGEIKERLREELMRPFAAGMVFPRFLGLLLREQKSTAERLGAAPEDAALKTRFEKEEADLKASCGL